MENKMTFADLRRQNKKLLRQKAGLKKQLAELEEWYAFSRRLLSANYRWYCHRNRVARRSAIWWRDQFFRADAENRRLRSALIAASSKQKPLRPFGEYMDFDNTRCPRCGDRLQSTYWIYGGVSYCPECGQAIDWGCE